MPSIFDNFARDTPVLLKLSLGVMDKSKVEHLQATALSIGWVLAAATLELWETKIRKSKRTEIGIDKYTKKLAAAALLRWAKDKRKRAEASKHAHDEMNMTKNTHTHTRNQAKRLSRPLGLPLDLIEYLQTSH